MGMRSLLRALLPQVALGMVSYGCCSMGALGMSRW